MTISEILKSVLFFLAFLYIAPKLVLGISEQFQSLSSPKSRVGVIPIKGVLYDSAPYIKQLEKFFKDTSIKAIMLKVECNGAASGTGEILFNEIQELKNEYPKPIITLVENICVSGGYWIACATDHIIAPSMALIGSIGVTMPYMFKLPDFLAEHKVGYENLKAGQFKTVTDPFVPMSEDERAMLQRSLDDSYQQFATSVANARKLNLNEMNAWAEGRIFNGHQALQLKLIDENGSLRNAIRVLKEKALIDGEIAWVKPPVQTSLWDMIQGKKSDSLFESAMDRVCGYVESRYALKRVY